MFAAVHSVRTHLLCGLAFAACSSDLKMPTKHRVSAHQARAHSMRRPCSQTSTMTFGTLRKSTWTSTLSFDAGRRNRTNRQRRVGKAMWCARWSSNQTVHCKDSCRRTNARSPLDLISSLSARNQVAKGFLPSLPRVPKGIIPRNFATHRRAKSRKVVRGPAVLRPC